MTGLVGAGLRKNIIGSLFLDTELLGGAAGGGGMAVGSGLVWQANAGAGIEIDPAVSVMIMGGRVEAVEGDFRANVLSVALACRFTGASGR
jgi:hypothetical protein